MQQQGCIGAAAVEQEEHLWLHCQKQARITLKSASDPCAVSAVPVAVSHKHEFIHFQTHTCTTRLLFTLPPPPPTHTQVKPDAVSAGQTILLPSGTLSARDREILEGIGAVYRCVL
jgi:hypothetical protein